MKLWLRILTVCVVLAVAGAAAWWFFLRPTSPEDTALAVFHALASGNPDRVDAAGIEVSDTARTAFVAAIAHLSEPELRHVELHEDHALVTIGFRLGSIAHASVVRLEREGNRWTPHSGDVLGSVTPQTTPGAGIQIDDLFHPNGEPLVLLPAVYPLAAAPTTALEGGQHAYVLPGDSFALPLVASFRPEQTSISQQQLNEYLDGCTRTASAVPANCGIRIPWGADLAALAELRFRVESYPVIALLEHEFLASGGVLIATAEGTDHAGTARAFTYRTTEWSVRGTIGFTPDGLTLHAW